MKDDYRVIEFTPTVRKYEEYKKEFYIEHLNIDDFLELYKKNINDLNVQLSFYEKFSQYQEIDDTIEVWTDLTVIFQNKGRTICIWPGYSISTSGRVWSHITNKLLTPSKINSGYMSTKIRNGKERSGFLLIHRATLSSFTLDMELSKEKLTVNHKRSDKGNNHLLNLEWMNHNENILDAKIKNGYSIKITLTSDLGKFKAGEIYYIHRGIELTNMGIEKHVLSNGLRNKKPRYGCLWEKVEDTFTTAPIEFLNEIKNYKRVY